MLQTMERLFYLSLTYPPSQVAASRIADRGRSRKVGSLRERKRCTRRTFDGCLPYGNLALYKEGDRRGSNLRRRVVVLTGGYALLLEHLCSLGPQMFVIPRRHTRNHRLLTEGRKSGDALRSLSGVPE